MLIFVVVFTFNYSYISIENSSVIEWHHIKGNSSFLRAAWEPLGNDFCKCFPHWHQIFRKSVFPTCWLHPVSEWNQFPESTAWKNVFLSLALWHCESPIEEQIYPIYIDHLTNAPLSKRHGKTFRIHLWNMWLQSPK